MSYYKTAENFMEDNGYDIDGTWYPRVTRIVGIKAKPALYRFYADLNSFEEGEKIKERSASEGTMIHDAAEAIFLGKEPEIDETIAPAITAFRDFIERNDIRVHPEYIERRVISNKHHYAGTCDAIAWINNKFGVLDIKTSVSIYRDYSLQTAAYYYALKPELPDLATRWILRIDQAQVCRRCGDKLRTKGGREKVRRDRYSASCAKDEHDWGPTKGEAELKEFPSPTPDYRAFLGAKMLWEWENHYWLNRLGYPMLLTTKST